MSNKHLLQRARRVVLVMLFACGCFASSQAHAQGFAGCEEWQIPWIEDAIVEAIRMVEQSKSQARFEEWFGPLTQEHLAHVERVEKRILDGFTYNIGAAARTSLEMFDAVGIGCGCQFGGRDLAEITGKSSFNVCNKFFESFPDGLTRGGVFIHEIVHFTGGNDSQNPDTYLLFTAYEYSRLIVQDPQRVIRENIGKEPYLLPWLNWPMVEPENYRFYFENPDRL